MIGGAKGIGLGIDLGLVNQYNRTGYQSYIEPEVLDSLVGVWSAYGMTNDSPNRSIIKNKLSNKGGDFVISNAAYEGMSGYNGYPVVFGANKTWANESNGYVTSITSNTIHIANVLNAGLALLYSYVKYNGNLQNIKEIPPFKIEIKGLEGRSKFIYKYLATSDATKETNLYLGNGTHELPKSFLPTEDLINNAVVGFSISPIEEGVTNFLSDITIKVLPEYEGAFVTDGIDDLITSTKTVQEMLGRSNEITVVSMIHQIGLGCRTNFICDKGSYWRCNEVANTGEGKTGIYGYSSTNISVNTPNIINNVLGDKVDYSVTGDRNDLTPSQFSVVGYISSSGKISYTSSVAWYWTIIANKVLTTDQINQVIAYFNLDRTLKPDILCNVKKQGITNENHAEFGDKLIDFSGNGRDIQLNNLAWDGDSGIGKYNYPNWKVTATIANTYSTIVNYPTVNGTYSINVNGVSELMQSIGLHLEIKYTTSTGIIYNDIKQDGVYSYILPDGATNLTLRFGGIPGIVNEPCNITITQIPSHAGGLCLDGINDFGKVTRMPIYKDYTIVVDYERISGREEALISKAYIVNQGAFVLMETSGTAKHSYSFGAYTAFNRDDFTRTLLYQSKYKCGDVNLIVGEGIDGDTLWLGTLRDNDYRFFNGAIYSLMSFPYSMSEFLIERQLKKHKLGTLYPDMVEFRPIVKSNFEYQVVDCYIDTFPAVVGNYYPINSKLRIAVTTKGEADEVISLTVNGVSLGTPSVNGNKFTFNGTLSDKSPQKINITIDEYIRYEDIVQPYPSLFTLIDYDTEEVYSWGSKLKVGARFKGNVVNLLPNMYEWQGNVLYNGEVLDWGIKPGVVAKEMVFSWNMPFKYLIDNNEPKVILSPRLLRIPNSSYKILGYIPDISGHGNHGVIHNSAYAEGSGVNEDGSYQFDGVDDFVTIPTTVGGKQVLMKVNSRKSDCYLYDQRNNWTQYLGIVSTKDFIAYNYSNQRGKTYIDGILNENITANDLIGITHNITVTNNRNDVKQYSPCIGTSFARNSYAQMALYDFMLFDEISTDDKIQELNEYVGIEAKVELPPYYWDTYGKTNSDADRDTIQQRGVAVGDYDLTNYNHAYNKMSGYGGYKFAKFDNTIEWFAEDSSMVVNRNGYLITLKKVPNVAFWRFRNTTLKSLDNPLTFKVKCNKPIDVIFQVKFAKNNDVSIGYNYNIKEVTLVPNESTTIIVPSVSVSDIPEATSILFINVLFDNTSLSDNEEYTVEMLPLYPNGLLYDAITDYSENVNIPVFTDFTAIMKRKWLKNQGCPLIKGSKVYEGGNGNALLFEWDKAYNFVFYKRTDIMEGKVPENISFITPTNYNGNVITRGSEQDTNGICIAGDGNAGFANMVFYKLILYPKTIPLLQINFLKNLMEKDEIIDLNNKIFIQE